ncbi:MAG TPA: lysophospholipid acyltransferase family protein [Candidatus Limnocylindrales bacterium]|nr:lysophospholipid acyltransferase family protein [Candidatus Limnocylindrales bacterium]
MSGPRATLSQRAVAALVAGLTALAVRLPEGLLFRAADLAGTAHYLIARRRRALARRNLRRVLRYLVANGPTTPQVLAGARGGRDLERLVRGVFQGHARYYLEVMRTARYTADHLAERLDLDDPDLVSAAFGAVRPGHGAIFVGLHFGAMELPVLYASHLYRLSVVAPMETIDNPALQAYYVTQRSRVGIRLIDPAGARQALTQALEDGAAVAIVGDRDLGGASRPVRFFGAEANLPVGPTLLTIQTGLPCWITGIRRTADGEYAARLYRLDAAAEGALDRTVPLRERVARLMAAQARAFERIVADAPEQWWSLLFPLWGEGAGR